MRPNSEPSGRGDRGSDMKSYMANKVAKLGVQFDAYAARAAEAGDGEAASACLFVGVVIHVNGLTVPSAAVGVGGRGEGAAAVAPARCARCPTRARPPRSPGPA